MSFFRPSATVGLALTVLLASSPPLASTPGKPGRQEKIIGGSNAARGAYPAMTALLYSDTANNYFAQFCAGTLIHRQWVVTAAHCVVDLIPSDLQVAVGAYNLNESDARVNVVDIIVHPDYDPSTSDSDIALLLLEQPVNGTPVEIVWNDDTQAAPGTMSTILGWGDTTNGNANFPTILQQAQVPIVSNATANQPSAYNGQVTSRMLAAGYASGAIDTCGGDSGGPLFVPATGGGILLAGITSWGNGCGNPNAYGIYTRISVFRSWIREHLHPGYGQWEADSGVALPIDQVAGDGTSALLAYALTAEPGSPLGTHAPRAGTTVVSGKTYPTITVPRWSGERTISWTIEESRTMRDWVEVDTATRQVGSPVPLAGGREEVTFRGGDALEDFPQAQIRLRPKLNDTFVPGVTRWEGTFNYDYFRLHSLLPSDPARPGGVYRYREILLSDLPASPIRLSLRARELTSHLRLENASTGETITTQSLASGAATDQLVSFTPVPGTTYRVIASTSTNFGSGPLRLAAFEPEAYPSVTVGGSQVSGSLTTSDYRDEYGPYTYYYDVYQLEWTGSPAAVTVTARSTDIDCYVQILDPETYEILWHDDDNGGGTYGTDSQARFVIGHPARYLVLVSSALPSETGSYTLQAATTTIPTLSLSTSYTSFTLSTDSRHDPDIYASSLDINYINEYLLPQLAAGTRVIIELEAVTANRDPYLYVFDAYDGSLVAENDDGSSASFNSAITLTVRANTRYLIRASTYWPEETGTYRIRVRSL